MSEQELQEPVRGLSKDEQETTVTRTRTGEWTYIDTTIPSDITALVNSAKRNSKIEVLKIGYWGTTRYGKFRIRSEEWNPARGVKRTREMTEEQKLEATARLLGR